MKSLISILVTVLLLSKNAAAGEVHSTVQTLTNTDFQEALNDPANGEFFFLHSFHKDNIPNLRHSGMYNHKEQLHLLINRLSINNLIQLFIQRDMAPKVLCTLV